jgi:hypothetical protein
MQMKWNNKFKCMEVIGLIRTKNLITQDHLVFCHYKGYLLCPFHATACHLILRFDGTKGIFPNILRSNVCQHLNSLLKSLSEKAKTCEVYTTHGIRIGASSEANEAPGMQIQWLVDRGGWVLGHLAQIFTYLVTSHAIDSRVGRALSGWPDLQNGI